MKINYLCTLLAFISLWACTPKSTGDVATATNSTSDSTAATTAPPSVTEWMSWEGGVDVAAITDTNFKMPNVIVHVARMVHTPVGSAPSGMILFQPDAKNPPVVMGFVSTDKNVGAYFGPKIFAGTPFEKAPVLEATFDIQIKENSATAKIVVANHTFELEMSDVGVPYLIHRLPAQMPPFYQQGVERKTGKTVLKVDGKEVSIIVPPVGITGGPGAVVSPTGVYAR